MRDNDMRAWLGVVLGAAVMLSGGPGLAAQGSNPGSSVVAVKVTGEEREKMTLEPSPGTVKAGRVTFKVQNAATTARHEMIVARLADPNAPLPYDAAKHKVIEAKLQALGEVSGIKPGETKSITLTLKPGTYLLLCNHTGHYEAGMVGHLQVTD
jgi:uncharacterized cupredoxin-like copper-binding protein